MKTARKMTEGAPWKHILEFAGPVLAGSLLQQLYNTVDTVVVGNYAMENSMSAVGTTGTMTFLFLAVAMGLSAGNCVIVAQFYGAGEEKKVRHAASTGIILLMILGLIATVLGLIFSDFIFRTLLNVDPSFVDRAILYFRIYTLGLLFQYGYNIFSSILRALGDSNATLYFLLISSVLNTALDFLFVAGFHWDVAGAAIATVISQGVSFVAAYIYMTKRYPIFRFGIKDYVWNKSYAAKTVTVGFPIALQLVIVATGLSFIQRAVNDCGPEMTSSFTVGQRIEMYLNLPCNAIQTTMATYTGQNIGAGKTDRVKKGTQQAVAMSFSMSVVIAALTFIFCRQIISLFYISEQSTVYCTAHIRAISLVNLILASYIPLFGVFQGTGHGSVPTVVATCALTVRVIVTFAFRNTAFFGESIIWWNGLFGFLVGCTITWGYYLSGRWKRNSVMTK